MLLVVRPDVLLCSMACSLGYALCAPSCALPCSSMCCGTALPYHTSVLVSWRSVWNANGFLSCCLYTTGPQLFVNCFLNWQLCCFDTGPVVLSVTSGANPSLEVTAESANAPELPRSKPCQPARKSACGVVFRVRRILNAALRQLRCRFAESVPFF